MWVAIVAGQTVLLLNPSGKQPWLKQAETILFTAFSIVYVVLLLVYGRKTPRPKD
jgi:hypothetical protein